MNVIKIKNGSSVSSIPKLAKGELAICTENNGLFYGDADGVAIQLNQSTSFSYVSEDADISVFSRVVLCNATGADIVMTLPEASLCLGREYTIKKTDSSEHVVIVQPYGEELIDGDTQFTMADKNETITVVSDGTNFFII